MSKLINGHVELGNCNETLIIAEIGINHNGSLSMAKEMISAANESGADIVKFQTYKADFVMTEHTPLASYMGEKGGNFLQLARSLELSFDETLELQAYCSRLNIEFLSSPFDVPSCEFLGRIGMRRLKIPSGETVNPFLLRKAAETKLPLIVSTGMASLDEVRLSLEFLKRHESGPVTLLHCTTQYPAEPRFCNLLAMTTMAHTFGLPVGYSDHTVGIEISIAAAALGATIIEKHFTLDKSLPGPDHAASLEPSEFQALVAGVRNVNLAMGTGEKHPFPIELELAKVARKSVVAVRALPVGHLLQIEDLTAKRPGTGIPAMHVNQLVGKRLKRSIAENSLLSWDDIV